MDDILICASDKNYLDKAVTSTIEAIQKAGFEIREDKVQYTSLWKYLGLQIHEKTIVPQQLTIRDDPKTLRNLQSLGGSINWIRPLLGITTEDLTPLFNLLRGNEDLDSPCITTTEAREAITKVQESLSSRQAHHYKPSLLFQFAILGKAPRFHGLIFQWDSQLTNSLLILEWVFTNNQPTKTITTFQEIMAPLIRKARTCLCFLAGCEFTCIYLPLTTGALAPNQ
ncbi:endogenous retrovirus group K member 18 Pol protein-like protein [Turdus rufiventris]|nr:endogenous retrovirus group K member 18 Pol protein-like protein [Turdus rufiventris]